MNPHIAVVLAIALPSFPRLIALTISPDQPSHKGQPGTFEIIGETLVSAQQAFLGRPDKVYILDKVENNSAQVNGHPAWASEYKISDNGQRVMDIVTNTFCAGGSSIGNGTWLNVGGNSVVSPVDGSYHDEDGRRSLLDPCDDQNCEWRTAPPLIRERWYTTLETLEDGSVIILGGSRNGGFVNHVSRSEPTYEFFPPNGAPVKFGLLENSLPANLYPLTWLLPSGKLLVQSNWKTSLLDYKANVETTLDDIPDAVRTYPGSGGTVMLPLTPENNWSATVMFCGGSDVRSEEWDSPNFVAISRAASTSCVKITPDVSKSYERDDPLPEGRSMTNLLLLPDGKILCINGARLGTAGYGFTTWDVGESFADSPDLTPVIYDPDAPLGQRWSSTGFDASTVPRMYHSTALLLPDGSVFVSGSNPHADVSTSPQYKYPTEYRTERFYPPYYNERRPQPKGLVPQLSYGGPAFDVALDSDDLFGDVQNIAKAKVVIIRPGFSTHAINMGQRMLVLESTFAGSGNNNTGILHVSQVPPNPAILAPGPALLFVVVKGVPSVGVQVMIGSGQIGSQPVLPIGLLPPSVILEDKGPTLSVARQSILRSDTSIISNGWLTLWFMLLATWTMISFVG